MPAEVLQAEILQVLGALRALLAAPSPHSAKAGGSSGPATERLRSELNLIAHTIGGSAGSGGNGSQVEAARLDAHRARA